MVFSLFGLKSFALVTFWWSLIPFFHFALQNQHDEIEAKFFEERAALEAKYQKLYQPFYTKVMQNDLFDSVLINVLLITLFSFAIYLYILILLCVLSVFLYPYLTITDIDAFLRSKPIIRRRQIDTSLARLLSVV